MQIDSSRSDVRKRVNPILINNSPSLCDVLRPESISHLLNGAPSGNVNELGVIAKYGYAMPTFNATIILDDIPRLASVKLSHGTSGEVETDIDHTKFSRSVLYVIESRNDNFGEGDNLMIAQSDFTKVV